MECHLGRHVPRMSSEYARVAAFASVDVNLVGVISEQTFMTSLLEGPKPTFDNRFNFGVEKVARLLAEARCTLLVVCMSRLEFEHGRGLHGLLACGKGMAEVLPNIAAKFIVLVIFSFH